MNENDQLKSSTTRPLPGAPDEISLVDIIVILVKNKKIILGVPLLAAIVTAVITLLMPNMYAGRAVLMPPQQQQSAAALMLGQLGAVSGMSAGSLGLKNPNDMYVGILRSRTIADALIEKFKLQELYETDTSVETRKELASRSAFTSGKDGLIVVEIYDEDPKRAADLANSYVSKLIELTQNLAISEASQRRLFFENQLKKTKEELSEAEIALQRMQEQTGLIALDEQGRATIEAAATLRAQITAKEVEMAAIRTYATEANPDYRRLQEELTGLRLQLSRMERGNGRDAGDILVSTGRIPAAGLEYARKLRDVKYYETVLELMARQFEVAKVDEARDGMFLQVVDYAIPQDYKSKPKRAVIVLLVTLLAAIFSCAFVISKERFNFRMQ